MARLKQFHRNVGWFGTVQFVLVVVLIGAFSVGAISRGSLALPVLLIPAAFVLAWVWREWLVAHVRGISQLLNVVWIVMFFYVLFGRQVLPNPPGWAAYALCALGGLYLGTNWAIYSDPRVVTTK